MAQVSGRSEEAIKELEGAIAGWDKIIKLLGENPNDLERKGVASLYCGRIKMQLGQREAAAKDLTVAADIQEKLVGNQPEIPVYHYDLGHTYVALGAAGFGPAGGRRTLSQGPEDARCSDAAVPRDALYRQALKELDALSGSKPVAGRGGAGAARALTAPCLLVFPRFSTPRLLSR